MIIIIDLLWVVSESFVTIGMSLLLARAELVLVK